jgi:RNAse (barnase) inhibitor barstar
MKALSAILLVFSCCACYSEAQTQKVLLLGSTQDIAKLPFCKTYKCEQLPEANAPRVANEKGEVTRAFYYYVPSTEEYLRRNSDMNFYPILHVTHDRFKQVTRLDFSLKENFVSNLDTESDETMMLSEALRLTIGKILPFEMSQGEKYSPDIWQCFLRAKAKFKDNMRDRNNARLMFSGKILMQVSKYQATYRAYCQASYSKGSKMYVPRFTIEIFEGG